MEDETKSQEKFWAGGGAGGGSEHYTFCFPNQTLRGPICINIIKIQTIF